MEKELTKGPVTPFGTSSRTSIPPGEDRLREEIFGGANGNGLIGIIRGLVGSLLPLLRKCSSAE